MKLYAQIINERTKLVAIGEGTNTEFYKSIGMEEMEVEQAYDGAWYIKGYAPGQPLEELKKQKRNAAGAAFAAKRDEIRYIKISDGNTYGFDCANEDITNFFASWKAAEKDGQTPYKVWHNETTKGMIIMQLVDFDTVFDVVRDSQIAAYGWYESVAAQIEAATTKEELESIVL